MQRDPAATPEDGPDADMPPKAVLITALVLAVAAAATVLAVAVARRPAAGPVVIATVPAPRADSAECRALLATLPDRLGDLRRAAAAEPVPAGAAAWGTQEEPVILRCGLGRPAEFVVGAPLQIVDDVEWFRIDDAGIGRSTWVSVDRPVYVALTLPSGSGPGPIQDLSGVIARSMPAVPIRPGPPR